MAISSIGKVVKLDEESGAKLAKVMSSESKRVKGSGSIGTNLVGDARKERLKGHE